MAIKISREKHVRAKKLGEKGVQSRVEESCDFDTKTEKSKSTR
jgi:hypothetical protein